MKVFWLCLKYSFLLHTSKKRAQMFTEKYGYISSFKENVRAEIIGYITKYLVFFVMLSFLSLRFYDNNLMFGLTIVLDCIVAFFCGVLYTALNLYLSQNTR